MEPFYDAVEGWAMLVPYLDYERKYELCKHLFKITEDILKDDSWAQMEIITKLIPHLLENLMSETIHISKRVIDKNSRVKLLVAFLPRLSWQEQRQMINEIIVDNNDTDLYLCIDTLIALLPYLPNENRKSILQSVVNKTQLIHDKTSSAKTITNLAQYLPHYERKIIFQEAFESGTRQPGTLKFRQRC